MLNKEDKADVKNAMGKAVANKVSKATNDGAVKGKDGYFRGNITAPSGKKFEITKPTNRYDDANRLTGSEKDALRKKYGNNRLTGSQMDEGRNAKNKAIHAKKKEPDFKQTKADIKEMNRTESSEWGGRDRNYGRY